MEMVLRGQNLLVVVNKGMMSGIKLCSNNIFLTGCQPTQVDVYNGSCVCGSDHGCLYEQSITVVHVVQKGWRGHVGGRSPRCFFWVLPMRSIPKPYQHGKDIIQ